MPFLGSSYLILERAEGIHDNGITYGFAQLAAAGLVNGTCINPDEFKSFFERESAHAFNLQVSGPTLDGVLGALHILERHFFVRDPSMAEDGVFGYISIEKLLQLQRGCIEKPHGDEVRFLPLWRWIRTRARLVSSKSYT